MSDSNLLDGARVYRRYCAVCHGLPRGDKLPGEVTTILKQPAAAE